MRWLAAIVLSCGLGLIFADAGQAQVDPLTKKPLIKNAGKPLSPFEILANALKKGQKNNIDARPRKPGNPAGLLPVPPNPGVQAPKKKPNQPGAGRRPNRLRQMMEMNNRRALRLQNELHKALMGLHPDRMANPGQPIPPGMNPPPKVGGALGGLQKMVENYNKRILDLHEELFGNGRPRQPGQPGIDLPPIIPGAPPINLPNVDPRDFGGGFPPEGMPPEFGGFGGQGQIRRLGITVSKPNETLADQLDLPKGQGLVISAVENGSAAEKAGLKAHDILLELNDKPVSSDMASLTKLLKGIKGGEESWAMVLRKGRNETIKGLKLPKSTEVRRGPGGQPIPPGAPPPNGIDPNLPGDPIPEGGPR